MPASPSMVHHADASACRRHIGASSPRFKGCYRCLSYRKGLLSAEFGTKVFSLPSRFTVNHLSSLRPQKWSSLHNQHRKASLASALFAHLTRLLWSRTEAYYSPLAGDHAGCGAAASFSQRPKTSSTTLRNSLSLHKRVISHEQERSLRRLLAL